MKFRSMLRDRRTFQVPDPGAGAAPADPGATPPASDTGPDLSFIPTDFHTDGAPDLGKFAGHYQELVARDAQASERAATIPEGDYDFTLPADLTFDGLDLPEGFTFQALDKDPAFQPLFGELGSVLKEIGAPAGAGAKVMSLLARYEATRFSQGFANGKAELATLGTPAQQTARMSTIERALDTRLPADQAKALKATMVSGKAIQALEALLGPRSFSPNPAPPAAKSVQDDLNDYYSNPSR